MIALRSRIHRACGAAVLSAALFAALIVPMAHADPLDCVPVTAGLDTFSRNSGRSTFLGHAVGQTFRAVDTVITRITVWRPPNDIDAVGIRLFVTTVDTTRIPPIPYPRTVIQEGPTVFVRDSDPPGHLIRVDFLLDPPLVLPHPGIYAFFLQREGCDAGQSEFIAAEPGIYPDGTFWITGRAISQCYLPNPEGSENLDLIFEIEYCREVVTATRRSSWGRLKMIYR